MQHSRTKILSIIVLAVLVTAALLFIINWNGWISVLEAKAQDITGRQVTLGNLDVDLSLSPQFTIKDITVANPSWATAPEMVNIGVVTLRLKLLPLLKGQGIHLSDLQILKPVISLERSAQGEVNWDFELPDKQKDDDSQGPVIQRLVIREGIVSFTDKTEKTDLMARIVSEPGSDSEGKPLMVTGDGVYKGASITLTARAGSLTGPGDKGRPLPVDLKLTSGKNLIEANGDILRQTERTGFDIDLSVKGENPADLNPLVPFSLPSLPPYDLRGKMTGDTQTVKLQGLAGTIGDSDISGDVIVRLAGERPDIYATLSSDKLDFDDLSSLIGGTPDTGAGETASDQQIQRARANDSKPTVLPNKPIKLDNLGMANARIVYSARRVQAKDIPMENVSATLELNDGTLQIKPFRIGLGGGLVDAELTLSGKDRDVMATIKASIDAVNLREILAKLYVTNDAAGKIDGRINVSGAGDSVGTILGSLNGDIRLIMQGGRLDSLLVELIGLDLGEAIVAFLTDSEAVTIRCALAEFTAEDGILREKTFLFDTTDTRIIGAGSINLKDETVDLTLDPRAKDFSVLSAQSRIDVKGPFNDIQAGPSKKDALLSLLTPIEFGDAVNADCKALQKSVREVVQ